MRKILFILLLLTGIYHISFAQHSVLKVGGGFGYECIINPNWNNAINNFVSPANLATGVEPNPFNHGFHFSIGADYLLGGKDKPTVDFGQNRTIIGSRRFDGISIGPSFTYSMFNASVPVAYPVEGSSFLKESGDIEFSTSYASLALDVDVYILKFFKNSFLSKVQESFFVRISPSYHWMSFSSEVPDFVAQLSDESTEDQLLPIPTIDDPTYVTPTYAPSTLEPRLFPTPNSLYEPDIYNNTEITTSNAFGLGLGAGYQYFVSDRLVLTGTVKMDMAFGHSITGLSEALAQDVDAYTNYDDATVVRPSFGVKLSYVIIQRLPLCPIETCQVQQEHRHNIEGKSIVVRGNKYSLRQNQKYGNVHRHDAKHKNKEKASDSEKRTQKRVNKRKKQRRKLRIFGQ